jgi:hypothetical protein
MAGDFKIDPKLARRLEVFSVATGLFSTAGGTLRMVGRGPR